MSVKALATSAPPAAPGAPQHAADRNLPGLPACRRIRAGCPMKNAIKGLVLSAALLGLGRPASAQEPADPVRILVQRLDLERYKTTIKGLTRFGDRRQGTQRNRDAIDWIEAQLKSYGCANTERLTYQFGEEPPHRVLSAEALHQAAGAAPEFGVGGARQRGVIKPTG